jgi:hypothetical protein
MYFLVIVCFLRNQYELCTFMKKAICYTLTRNGWYSRFPKQDTTRQACHCLLFSKCLDCKPLCQIANSKVHVLLSDARERHEHVSHE